jgi:hypothetical protein
MEGYHVVIVGIDPGATTGFATFDNGIVTSYEINLMNYPHPHEVFYDHLCEMKPNDLAYEAFLHRQGQTGIQFTGVEMIAIIKLWTQQNKIESHLITASHGKAFWSNEKLKFLGFYKSGQPHGMDALRILFTHLSKINSEWMEKTILELKGLTN